MTRSPQALEREKVLLASRGDERAFAGLYESYFDSIYRFFVYRTSSALEAEDLSGQCFLQAWEHLSQNSSAEVKNFRAWLFRIAHNLLVDYYRKKQPAEMEEEMQVLDKGQIEPEGKVLMDEQQRLLIKGLSRLNGVHRDVLVCRMVSGLSHAETADVLDLKVGHVRVLQHRALAQLRAVLKGEGWQ